MINIESFMFKLIFAVALLALGASPAVSEVDGVVTDVHSLPMRFEWRQEGPADTCGSTCRSWVFAVGVITGNTPADFNTFVQGRGAEDAMIVLDSPGGSALAAMTLGGMIRRLRMTTAVGRTIELPARDGKTPPAKSISRCGLRIHVRPFYWPGSSAMCRRKRAFLCTESGSAGEATTRWRRANSAVELAIMQRDLGLLAQYTIEMGGSIELFATAARVTPWEPLRLLLPDELRRMGLTNSDHLFDGRALESGNRRCDQIGANCSRRTERLEQTR